MSQTATAAPPAQPKNSDLPSYLVDVYSWAYVNPAHVAWLDRDLTVRVLLFGNDLRLQRAYLDEIPTGSKLWQVAHVYGDLVRHVADKVGRGGHFLLTDVAPVQVAHAVGKLVDRPWAQVLVHDAAIWRCGAEFDRVGNFFLLHEVPDAEKRAVVERMLAALAPGGKAVFVDYHRPAWWQPVGWILRVVNALLEPFAHALWQHEIWHFAPHPEQFTWRKRTFFGGIYQLVVAERRAGPN
jgi:SAM-dependent methyltransferase